MIVLSIKSRLNMQYGRHSQSAYDKPQLEPSILDNNKNCPRSATTNDKTDRVTCRKRHTASGGDDIERHKHSARRRSADTLAPRTMHRTHGNDGPKPGTDKIVPSPNKYSKINPSQCTNESPRWNNAIDRGSLRDFEWTASRRRRDGSDAEYGAVGLCLSFYLIGTEQSNKGTAFKN